MCPPPFSMLHSAMRMGAHFWRVRALHNMINACLALIGQGQVLIASTVGALALLNSYKTKKIDNEASITIDSFTEERQFPYQAVFLLPSGPVLVTGTIPSRV